MTDISDSSSCLLIEQVRIRVGQDLEPHLVSNLLQILIQFIWHEKFGILAKSAFKDGEHEPAQPRKGIGVDLGKEDIGSLGELLLVIFDKPLEAGRHVENILLLIDCENEGWDFLFQVIFYQLNVYPHITQLISQFFFNNTHIIFFFL